MGEQDDARRSIESSRARMSLIAEELSRRTSSEYVGGRAKEVARMRADNARTNPRMLGTLGAIAGATLGTVLAKAQKRRSGKREHLHERTFYGYGAAPDRGGGFRTRPSWVSREYAPPPTWDAQAGYPSQPWEGGRYPGGPDYVASPEVSTVGVEGWRERPDAWQGSAAQRVQREREGYAYGTRQEGLREGYEYGTWQEGQEGRRAEGAGGISEKTQQLKSKAEEMKGRAAGTAEEFKGRAAGTAEELKGKASHLKETVTHKASDLRSKVSEHREHKGEGGSHMRESMKARASSIKERMPSRENIQHRTENLRQRSHEHPMGMILGSILIGAAAAALLPLSSKERKVMHPARERATSKLGPRLRSFEEKFESAIGGGSHEEESRGTQDRSFSGEGDYGAGGEERSFSGTDSGTYSRDDIAHSNEGEEPYRQPDLAEVTKDETTVH